jgi:nitroreductase
MSLYETIFTRSSVREYDKTPLTESELAVIQSEIDNAKQIPGFTARFEIANADQLKGAASPHAILVYSDDSDAAYFNAGYTLQTLDLYLQSKGYGSIWMGMAKPIKPAPDYRILMAFGKTNKLKRSEADFKRKDVSEISNEDNAIARAARLAPSAVNFQPWKLEFTPGKVTINYAPKTIGKLLMGKLQKLDLGICAKHVELALDHEGKIVTQIKPIGEGKKFAAEISYKEN